MQFLSSSFEAVLVIRFYSFNIAFYYCFFYLLMLQFVHKCLVSVGTWGCTENAVLKSVQVIFNYLMSGLGSFFSYYMFCNWLILLWCIRFLYFFFNLPLQNMFSPLLDLWTHLCLCMWVYRVYNQQAFSLTNSCILLKKDLVYGSSCHNKFAHQ